MQTTRRVGATTELAAGVKLGEHDLERRDLLAGVQVDRNASPVVGDLDRPVTMQVMSTLSAKPADASSTALSISSQTRCMRPSEPVPPMYMPRRLRTASNPSRVWVASAS